LSEAKRIDRVSKPHHRLLHHATDAVRFAYRILRAAFQDQVTGTHYGSALAPQVLCRMR